MTEQIPHGIVEHDSGDRKTDYLYRISIKALIRNIKGEVLVVKETDRDWWDLPGGGMDHGEDIKSAIARELSEEVNFRGDFDYRIISVEEPSFLEEHRFWQLRIIFEVKPENMTFKSGVDGDATDFIAPDTFKDSGSKTEQRIYEYFLIASDQSKF